MLVRSQAISKIIQAGRGNRDYQSTAFYYLFLLLNGGPANEIFLYPAAGKSPNITLLIIFSHMNHC